MAPDNHIRHYPDAVVNHQLSRQGFLKTLAEISKKDYEHQNYFAKENIPALDIDAYEISLRKGNMECTADAVIGICSKSGDKIHFPRLMMLELRLDYDNVRNLSTTELVQKKSHTSDILKGCDNLSIDPNYCLIFREGFDMQAHNWLERENRGNSITDSWLCLTIKSFIDYINFYESDKFKPCVRTLELEKAFHAAVDSKDNSKIERAWNSIRTYISTCSLQYKLNECGYLANSVKEKFSKYTPVTTDEDEQIIYEILDEDIEKILKRHLG